MRLLIDITTRVATYRDGLQTAASRLSKHEATIVADLEQYGLDLPQLREVLWGGHVLVDDPALYEKWRFPKSRERLSSHHKTVDKKAYPDLGLTGPVVREKLHGRTASGTWVQLEKTPASMGDGFRLPTLHDVVHLWDFVVYRITKSNVGPWGLSKQTERRPMYLAPSLATTVAVPQRAERELLEALTTIEQQDDVTSASPDLARRFPPPHRTNTLAELAVRPGTRNGRGLFGASDVHIAVQPRSEADAQLDRARSASPQWTLPPVRHTRPTTITVGQRELRTAVRVTPVSDQEEDT